MKIKRLLFLLIIIPTSLFGQDTTSVKGNKLFFGINYSADFCYRFITKNDNNLSNDLWMQIKNLEDSIYKPTYGYSTGLNCNYQIKKWLSIELGIQYTRKGFQTIPFPTYYNINYSPELATNYIYYHYINVPIKVNFTFLDRKFQIITSVGTTINYLIKVNTKIVPKTPTNNFQTQSQISNYSYSKMNIFPIMGIGFKYNIKNEINVLVQPTFSVGLINTDKDSYSFTHLWSAGLNFGLNYAF